MTPSNPTRDLLIESIADTAARITHTSELELCSALVSDFTSAAATLAPFEHRPKITLFGSARLRHSDPAYSQVRALAAALAGDGYVIVTGGGPGIMTAGLEGAGTGNAVGVSIRLPFETPAFHLDIPVVSQAHFPTRKLSMIRHVRGFVAAPGGIGTLDEIAEVLTLLQTGHKQPTPVILLDDGNGLWDGLLTMFDHMAHSGLISPSDQALYTVAPTWEDAHAHIRRFWSRYRGCHGSAQALVMRLSTPVTDDEATVLANEFDDLAPVPHHEGLLCGFDGKSYGRLRQLIDAVNEHSDSNDVAPADDGNMRSN